MNQSLPISLLVCMAFANTLAAAEKASKPNILIIYADDLGYGDVSCYNPERGKIPTPNIDKLAAEGMRFSDGHSSSGVCSPSRYTLLTGRYHWRGSLKSGIVGLWAPPAIEADRLTIGGLVKQHGYHTACIGKWHLGWDWPIPKNLLNHFKAPTKGEAKATDANREAWQDVFSKSIPNGPTTRGFDTYFGTDVPNWPPFCFIENDRTLGIPTEFLPSHLLKKEKNQASNPGPALADWKLEEILPALTERTIAYITASTKNPEPFLLYLALTSPHTPIAVNEKWVGKSGLGAYADFVMETDAEIGRVLDSLEKSGKADNTLVFFSSDNGCAPYIGADKLEMAGHFPSGPLRGYKSDAWEGGHRVPFIVRWPGVVKPGSTSGQLVHQADLMRTIAEILDADLPENSGEDSFSLFPILKGEDQPIRKNAVSASIKGIPALRDGSWKYIPSPGSGGWGMGGDTSQPVQLYDLTEDLGEKKNLASEMPEKVTEMKVLLEKLTAEGRSVSGSKR